jgi:hypothetical protein
MKQSKRTLPRLLQTSLLIGCCWSLAASAQQPGVSFESPKDGAVVSSPVTIKFGVTGMEVRPAGDMTPNTGHHHLLINQKPVAAKQVVPADEQHIHYGQGQTEAQLKLAPGKYRLTAQFANGAHQSYGPGMSETIDITVK